MLGPTITALAVYFLLMAIGIFARCVFDSASMRMENRAPFVARTSDAETAIAEQENLTQVYWADQNGFNSWSSLVQQNIAQQQQAYAQMLSAYNVTLTAADIRCGNLYDAQTRSITLMKEWLSPEQLASYEAHSNFIVTAPSGNRYRINHGGVSNVDQLDAAGNTVAHLCFQPSYCTAVGDIMLAQKVMLETDEAAALRVANRTCISYRALYDELATTRAAFAGSMQREMERANYRNNGL